VILFFQLQSKPEFNLAGFFFFDILFVNYPVGILDNILRGFDIQQTGEIVTNNFDR